MGTGASQRSEAGGLKKFSSQLRNNLVKKLHGIGSSKTPAMEM